MKISVVPSDSKNVITDVAKVMVGQDVYWVNGGRNHRWVCSGNVCFHGSDRGYRRRSCPFALYGRDDEGYKGQEKVSKGGATSLPEEKIISCSSFPSPSLIKRAQANVGVFSMSDLKFRFSVLFCKIPFEASR